MELESENLLEIDYQEITNKQFVANGSFGRVFRGEWRGHDVAVKEIVNQSFNIELRQLSRVQHENIIRLYGACIKPPKYCLVMEYAEGGSLFYILHTAKNIEYNLSHALSWTYQCAKGIAYLHGMTPKSLIHRDIKSPNLLMVNGGTLLKICDFGTAADKNTEMTNNKGSAAWMAPEVFATTNYTEKCDVYSYGIIFWEILARQRPFNKSQAVAVQIQWSVYKGERPPLLKNCPKVIEDLICRCWHNDPNVRPDMSYIVQLMEKIVSIFPNTTEPVLRYDRYDSMSSYKDIEEEEDFLDLSDEINPSSFQQTTNSKIVLSQPTEEMMKPLSLSLCEDWEMIKGDEMSVGTEILQPTAGFDKIVHKSTANDAAAAGVVQMGMHQKISSEDTADDLDSMYMLLEEDLRPATPDLSDPASVALFEEHKQLAQEYFKVQTDLVYTTQKCQKLRETTQSAERLKRQQNIKQLQDERDSLLLFRDALLKEKDKLNARGGGGGGGAAKANRNSHVRRVD